MSQVTRSELREQYERDGYVIVRNVLDAGLINEARGFPNRRTISLLHCQQSAITDQIPVSDYAWQ